ncbi:hypothetical protein [Niveibacterium sp.]|uniref:hypothetical protein n=1 Tax=Niveibacterium sp. TaxID=2017444 RepID=UPI0035B4B463
MLGKRLAGRFDLTLARFGQPFEVVGVARDLIRVVGAQESAGAGAPTEHVVTKQGVAERLALGVELGRDSVALRFALCDLGLGGRPLGRNLAQPATRRRDGFLCAGEFIGRFAAGRFGRSDFLLQSANPLVEFIEIRLAGVDLGSVARRRNAGGRKQKGEERQSAPRPDR